MQYRQLLEHLAGGVNIYLYWCASLIAHCVLCVFVHACVYVCVCGGGGGGGGVCLYVCVISNQSTSKNHMCQTQ